MEREGTIHISNLRLVSRPKAARAEKKKKETKGKK
jgi:ribosomal protein L24